MLCRQAGRQAEVAGSEVSHSVQLLICRIALAHQY